MPFDSLIDLLQNLPVMSMQVISLCIYFSIILVLDEGESNNYFIITHEYSINMCVTCIIVIKHTKM